MKVSYALPWWALLVIAPFYLLVIVVVGLLACLEWLVKKILH